MEPQVFDLLEFLVRNRDRVVSKDDLLASVWGGRIVSDSTQASRINAALDRLLNALGLLSSPQTNENKILVVAPITA